MYQYVIVKQQNIPNALQNTRTSVISEVLVQNTPICTTSICGRKADRFPSDFKSTLSVSQMARAPLKYLGPQEKSKKIHLTSFHSLHYFTQLHWFCLEKKIKRGKSSVTCKKAPKWIKKTRIIHNFLLVLSAFASFRHQLQHLPTNSGQRLPPPPASYGLIKW